MAKERLRIGELAAQVGLSAQAIRFYETRGLLGPSERQGKGYRYYGDDELMRLRKIKVLQDMGLTLEDIGRILPLYYSDPTGVVGKRKILELLRAQLEATDRKIAAIQTFREEIARNIAKFENLIQQAQARSASER
jgi:MerR family copper efflux transcriptional regulator